MSKTTTHYVSTLVRHAQRLNLDVDELLADTGIARELSQAGDQWIDNRYVTALVKTLWRKTNNETMGFDPEPLRIGSWALACEFMLSAQTLGEMLRRGEHIFSYLPPASLTVRLQKKQEYASVLIDTYVGENDPAHFLMEFMTTVWHRFSCWAIDENIQLNSAFFSYPKPPHGQFYEELFQCDIAFEKQHNGFSFHKKYLNKPVTKTQTELNSWLRDSPADLMYLPGRETSVQARIKAELTRDLKARLRFPAFESVCEKLHMSPQVIRRRLTEEGTSYQKIKDALRCNLAVELLGKPELPIANIADSCGFTEPAAFSRAFKKWMGVSPADYRARKNPINDNP